MEEKALVTQEQDLSLEEYGGRSDVAALGRRIRSMMPGGEKLTSEQAMAVAQYSMLADANPFRGEIYGYADGKGKLVLVEGYKLLVRWAKQRCGYSEKYETCAVPDGDIGFTCWILRSDALPTLKVLIEGGADYREAFEIAATSAVGIVRKADMWSSKYKRAIAPPKGWTWDQVARKRALKNALNLSHGAPSPREIAAESWKVGGTDTVREDWAECTPNMLPEARERLAQITAWNRKHEAEPGTAETLRRNRAILHGDDDDLDLTAAARPHPFWDDLAGKPEPKKAAPKPAAKKKASGNGRIWRPSIVKAAMEEMDLTSYKVVGRLNLSTLDPGDADDVIHNWLKMYDEARATAESKEAAVIANAWLAGEMKDAGEANDG